MKNKILFSLAVLFFVFCFVVLLKGLKNSNIYTPNTLSEKTLISFESKDLYFVGIKKGISNLNNLEKHVKKFVVNTSSNIGI